MKSEELNTRVGKQLPRHVSRVVTKQGTDSTGDPAVWVWIILKDEMLEDSWKRERREEMRDLASKAVRDAGIDHWVYVHFRTEKEQRELEKSSS